MGSRVGARQILIRADASTVIGAGHVMRCLALAVELRARGWTIRFATRPADGDLRARVQADGFDVVDPGPDQAREVDRLLQQLGTQEWLIVDHYAIDVGWLRASRRLAQRRLVLDDLADRPFDAEWLVDPDAGATPEMHARLLPPGCRMLVGPRFAPLPAEFRQVRGSVPPIHEQVGRIAVSMGGSDPGDATRVAVRAAEQAVPGASIDVILGPSYRHPDPSGARVVIHRAPASLAALLATADLCVGAGGSSSLERCVIGLPSVTVILAENQVAQTAALVREDATVAARMSRGGGADELEGAIARVAGDLELRTRMRVAGMALVDGWGAIRVANVIDGIRLRRAGRRDARLLWRWANDPATRANSLSPDPIAWDDHLRWLDRRLADAGTDLLIGSDGRGPAGQVRLDLDGAIGTISISVAPGHRGGGTGGLLLEAALSRWRRAHPLVTFRAVVKSDNAASRRLFGSAGFVPRPAEDGVIEYVADPVGDRPRPPVAGAAS